MATTPNQLPEPPPNTALENIWSTNRRVNLKLVVSDDEHWDKENPSNDPNHTRFVKDVHLRDKRRSMKDMMGNIWRITQKDFRAAIDDPKGVWLWSAEARFAVSVAGVVDEMSTQFCYVEGERSEISGIIGTEPMSSTRDTRPQRMLSSYSVSRWCAAGRRRCW